MKKSAMLAGVLMALVGGAEVRAADLYTAPILVHQNELVTCQALSVGTKPTDLTVDMIDAAAGSVFGPATCGPVLKGGSCLLASVSGGPDDRLIYCRVSGATKRTVRGAIQVNGGASAVAQ